VARRVRIGGIILGAMVLVLGVGVFTVGRPYLRAVLRPEPPAPLTPIALTVATAAPAVSPSATPAASTPAPTAFTATPGPTATPTPIPASPTPAPPTPVVVGERSYTVLLPAAVKEGQRFQYSCEFDAAWVILQSYGFDVTVDQLIEQTPQDTRIEPAIAETAEGFLIYGGDITRAFSGDYTGNYLARSTSGAFTSLFEQYGLPSVRIGTRAEVEAALLRGELIWMKTTVDFKPWRPATWITPEGERIPTVLGNDHAVVVMGFNDEVVVIRDVLGPTSSGPNRPLQYEVTWETFMAAWGAQNYDALAVGRLAQGAPLPRRTQSTRNGIDRQQQVRL
jgi:uncharacterized protein YvpB